MFGVFGTPFDISPKLLRAEHKNMTIMKVRDFSDPAWDKLPSHPLRPLRKAPFHYAFNAPLSGAFNDVTGFAKVRLGEAPKAGSVRTIDLNGTFKVRDKKGFPANWVVIPKRPGSTATVSPSPQRPLPIRGCTA